MKKQTSRRQSAKNNDKGHPDKEKALPSIDVLIRKICRTHTTVGIVVKR